MANKDFKTKDAGFFKEIKYKKLLQCLPKDISIKIRKERIDDYVKTVERAEMLQIFLSNDNLIIINNEFSNYVDFSKQISKLSKKYFDIFN